MLELQRPATVVFCILSSTHYSGQANATLRRFGRSEQKRNSRSVARLRTLPAAT